MTRSGTPSGPPPDPPAVSASADRGDRDTRAAIERLAWILDEAIRLPGGYRIGLDGLMGLIPGAGDALGMAASGYIVLVAHRLGVPGRILARMIWNVLLETVIGIIPLAGDVFDFAWKANSRNIALMRRHRAQRSSA